MDPTVLFGSLSVVGSLFILWWTVSGDKRIDTISLVEARPGEGQRDALLRRSGTDRALGPLFRGITRRLVSLMPSQRVRELEKNITRAGLSEKWPLDRVVAVKVLGGLLLFVLFVTRFFGAPSAPNFLLLLGSSALGFFAPNVLIKRAFEARQLLIRKDIADFIDQLNIMVRAGLAIDAAISRVVERATGPLAEEFSRLLQDMRFGIARNVAFANMAERIDVPELSSFITALAHAERLGVPISQTLKTQAVELRMKRRQLAEEQAMKLPVKILFPMVICILPTLFIVLLAPALLNTFESL